MPPVGDGFSKSLEHPHFIKVFIGFLLILFLAWFSYHRWFKETVVEKPAAEYQAKEVKNGTELKFQIKNK